MRRTPAAGASAIFFAAAPGTVAVLVPWWITHWEARIPFPGWIMIPMRVVGGLLALAGLAVLIHAFTRFVVEGLGTPLPAAPPERLVVGGLYRHVRNPMYVAVLVTILGQALLLAQPSLLVYALVVMVPVVSFVRWYEEPTGAHLYRIFPKLGITSRAALRDALGAAGPGG
ncbi:isoprenylcysteine carboxylmethyltransferase family protein [Nonomuraea sp. NEAU-A123]|uniref:methyltransferase family protein n=1 Tax=Nonomuraea sp. NEAU-A123 TaxID=2839649 RepID=UPI001BE3F2E1|nr:phosphatidylethanolamine N-methyltransferase family protein [Nonomuraea sp. NEAU-A123]MBT2235265.1 isoprenylcysteine carboxyl methyltransferase [Nonomuraea sp. NEAU-A123]